MIRSALRWLAARFGVVERDVGGTDEAADEEGSEDSRFVTSWFDRSVRYADGGSGSALDREVARVQEQARTAQDQSRDR